MKRTPLLNRHVSALIATLGHGDEVIIADAGLPVPQGVPVIDLAVKAGLPGFFDVLDAIRSELAIEAAVWADEASGELHTRIDEELDDWADSLGSAILRQTCPHESFKQRSRDARAIIRTGETTPYANIILVSGVVF